MLDEHRTAEKFFQALPGITRYMSERVAPRLEGILNKSSREQCVHRCFLKALCWMKTLTKLNEGAGFQAVTAGVRSLLEIAVDLILIRHDEQAPQRLLDWETCVKFKAAAGLVKYFASCRVTIPDEYKPLEIFHTQNRTRVTAIKSV
jgi:hypothetical protein